jgi:Xaa-Pro aminopeptidase
VSREQRRQQLAELVERLALGAILLKRPANFAWYTGGADNRVDRAAPLGVAGIVVTRDSEYVITDNIEFARMREEQTPGLEVVEHPWYDDEIASLRELTGGAPLGADFFLEGAYDVSDEVAPLRYVLDADTIERYRHVGADAAAAMREADEALDPEMSEHEAVANLLAACCRRASIVPWPSLPANGALFATGTLYRKKVVSAAGLCSWYAPNVEDSTQTSPVSCILRNRTEI